MIDLRIATAARAAGRAEHADGLVAWVTAQARANYDIVPENYDRITGDYQGEVPMIGFGAGAYITALWERGDPDPNGSVDAGVGTDAGTPALGDGAGCCQTTSSPRVSTLAMIAMVGAGLLGRRRRRRRRLR